MSDKLQLLDYQERILNDTKNMSKVAYYLDMGLGKTFVGSEKSISIGNDIIIVVCQKSKLQEWIDHYNEYYSDEYNIFNVAKKVNRKKFNSYNGKKVAIVNYDMVYKITEFNNIQNLTLVLDESSLIKNYKAIRTRYICDVLSKKATGLILLSGSPCGGRYEELYTQIKLLGWNKTKKYFYDNYTDYIIRTFSHIQFKEIIRYKNIDLFKQELKKLGCIFMKTDEVINLPCKTFIEQKINNTLNYTKFNKSKIVNVENIELVGDTPLTEMLYKRQLASMYNRNKVKALYDLINSTDEKLIVFYNFNYELKIIKKICDELDKCTSEVNGTKRDLFAYENVENSVTAIQYQSGAMGLNLQLANKIIYFSLPLSSELFEQSKKRIHRIKQKKPCYYYVLLTKNSIDEKIYKTLKTRNDYTLELFKKE